MQKIVLSIGALVVVGLLILLVVVVGNISPATTVRVNATDVVQTSQARSDDHPAFLNLSLQTNKTCYLVGEPVEARIEIANLSDRPVTIWKSLHFFSAGGCPRTTLFVNGQSHLSTLHVMVLFEGPTPEEEYVTLYPYEASVALYPSLLSLTTGPEDPPEFAEGQYELVIEYRNNIPGRLYDIVLQADLQGVDYEYEPTDVWTGILRSRPVVIQIVGDLDQCPDSTLYATSTPLPLNLTPQWVPDWWR